MIVGAYSWLEKLSELFMAAGRSAPRYQQMALLYPRSKKLQSSLNEYFLVVVRVCHDMLKLKKKSIFSKLTSFMTESDVSSYQSDFDLWATAIKEEVDLLMAQEIQEQSRHLKTLSKYTKSELHREKLEDRLRILDSCSTYDYQTTWKELRRRGNTSWFTLQPEYQDWKVRSESSTLLYSGKLGSGKSFTLANMVDDLNLNKNGNLPVAYFFCQHEAPESLRARTILGSLARQLLCAMEEIAGMLENQDDTRARPLDPNWILSLLKRTIPPTTRAYFVLDGLDECDEREIMEIINCLQAIQDVHPLLACLSFRQEAGNTMAMRLTQLRKPRAITIPEDNPDIADFIQTELVRRVESSRLVFGEPTIVLEIRDALLEKAQGMFLWVVLQIDCLCLARTDEAIRQALANLPKDLPTTFSRILEQSAALGGDYQRRTLELITAACRPLTTNELREALGVVPGETDWDPAHQPNDIYATLACCGSLLHVDEETLSVKLIHHSVKQYLLSGPEGITGQTFTLDDANKTMTTILITYLSYGVFDTQISTSVMPRVQHGAVPNKVISSVLDSSSIRKVALGLLKSSVPSKIDVSEVLAKETQHSKSQRTEFFFLLYAKSYWAEHIAHILWRDPAIVQTLGRILDRNVVVLDTRDEHGRTLLLRAVELGYEAVVRLLIEKGAAVNVEDDARNTPLIKAAMVGDEAVVRLLLSHGALINMKDRYGQTALSWAAEGGYRRIVRLLIGVDADVISENIHGLSPLWLAANNRHEATVQLLLEEGAVNDTMERYGGERLFKTDTDGPKLGYLRPPGMGSDFVNDGFQPLLFAAAGEGHEVIVRLLLERGAAIDYRDFEDKTLLTKAAEAGQYGVAKLLLDKGFYIDAQDGYGQTPLFKAAERGHEAIVQLLLMNGASPHQHDNSDRSPLMAAAKGGYVTIVRMLLDHGAIPTWRDVHGQSAADVARMQLHQNIVQLLLDRGG
ncbi:ankyrin repeat-containing domain protein [Ilyonectria destructans]|nr:ankyrin repeat-containing domain protein [Ilyonectria destructans]